jgi:hypothetical protein
VRIHARFGKREIVSIAYMMTLVCTEIDTLQHTSNPTRIIDDPFRQLGIGGGAAK